MSETGNLSSKDKRQLQKRRKQAAKQAQDYHREQNRQNRKSSEKTKKSTKQKKPEKKKKYSSKIEEAVNTGQTAKFEKISREEKFRRKGEEKIRTLEPRDFEDGYYIDEYGEKVKIEKRAKVIRSQEREVIRRNKKPMTARQTKLRRVLISSALLLAVLVIGVVLSLTVLFKTEKIDIEGDSYYYEDQIIHFSNVALQQNIFIAAINGTPQEISDNLFYVEKAEIGFAIPDTVTIKITNAVPSYYIKDGNNYLIISSKGRVLESTTELTEPLAELICGDLENIKEGEYLKFQDESVTQILDTVAVGLKNNNIDKIVGFDISNPASIKLNYDGRLTINIGLPEDIDYKLKTAITIINEKLDPNNTGKVYGTLDVSTCNKNKMSHYKPPETQPTTEPVTTQPATEDPNSYYGYDVNGTDYGYYSENGENGEYYEGYNSGDEWGYDDNSYSYNQDNSWGEGNSYGDGQYTGEGYGDPYAYDTGGEDYGYGGGEDYGYSGGENLQ